MTDRLTRWAATIPRTMAFRQHLTVLSFGSSLKFFSLGGALLCAGTCPGNLSAESESPSPDEADRKAAESTHWTFEADEGAGLSRKGIHGETTSVPGVEGRGQSLDGRSLFVVDDSSRYAPNDPGFTLTMWINPYAPGDGGQQMLAGKNVYSRDQREWGVMIDRDGRVRLYLWQDGWKTITAEAKPKPGHWRQVGVAVRPSEAELWVNGEKAGSLALSRRIPRTAAPLTFGGIDDGGRIRQTFFGAIDEAHYFGRPLPAEDMAALFEPHDAALPIPEPSPRFPLWDENAELPAAADLPELDDVEFHVIKKWDKPTDGYTFLHGVALAWHEGNLYASFGHNRGAENTVTEEAHYRVSEDGGKTWGPLQVIDAGEEKNLAVSHGVFLSHEGTLWAFHGAYYGRMENIHTRAYRLDDDTGEWEKVGVVVEDGFWPMNQPVEMEDGNWILPGGCFGRYSNDGRFPPAVAISRGDDFTKWDLVEISVSDRVRRLWGESALVVDGATVTSIARYGGDARALAAESADYGRAWSSSRISNLPMATSKPAAGMLSTGQRYLVCTTAKNNGGKRTPLTIAVSRPGENRFSKVLVIRRSEHGGAGESAERLNLSYPCATEHEGRLYVGYSNDGGRKGNLNSAELAVIPIEALAVE